MSTKLNIEQLFASKLEGLEQTPSPSVWKKTARAVRRKQFFRFKIGRFNIYYLAGIVLIGATITYYLTAKGAEGNAEERNIQSLEIKNITPGPDNNSGVEEEINQDNQSLNDVTSQDAGREIKSKSPSESKLESEAVKILQSDENKNKTVDDVPGISGSESVEHFSETVSTLVPYFTPSVYEGCAPLTVTFLNSSINATSITWNFGIAEPLHNSNAPVVTYATPGTYTITLTAMDTNGMQKSHSATIAVHPRPDATFEIDQNSIYNYSVNASEFSWYVLHNEDMENNLKQIQPFSTVFQPSLSDAIAYGKTFNDQDAYLVLVAKNTFGCTDIVSKPLPATNSPQLVFPTAFSPNPNGSIGGYYNPNDPDNQIFHPNFEEVPESYQLRIFNKAGTRVFASTDIYFGWDGYYQEAPAPRGVYIYQCTGTWKNGEPFQYRGDITILWNEP